MPRKQHSFHYIYRTTCSVTGRFYVGMHSTSNLEDDYIGSGSRLWRSIKKHGRENHTKEILEFLDTREKLKIREKEIVNENFLSDLLCMNMKVGGDGGFSKEAQISNGIKGNQRMKWLRENDQDWLEKTNEKNRDSQKKSYREGRMPVVPSWRGKIYLKNTETLSVKQIHFRLKERKIHNLELCG